MQLWQSFFADQNEVIRTASQRMLYSQEKQSFSPIKLVYTRASILDIVKESRFRRRWRRRHRGLRSFSLGLLQQRTSTYVVDDTRACIYTYYISDCSSVIIPALRAITPPAILVCASLSPPFSKQPRLDLETAGAWFFSCVRAAWAWTTSVA